MLSSFFGWVHLTGEWSSGLERRNVQLNHFFKLSSPYILIVSAHQKTAPLHYSNACGRQNCSTLKCPTYLKSFLLPKTGLHSLFCFIDLEKKLLWVLLFLLIPFTDINRCKNWYLNLHYKHEHFYKHIIFEKWG